MVWAGEFQQGGMRADPGPRGMGHLLKFLQGQVVASAA